MNRPTNQLNKVMNPESLLEMIQTQARTKSYDLGMGLAAQFVTALIRSGQIKGIKDANDNLEQGLKLIRPTIEKELVALSLGEIQASMPKQEEIPGVTVPAKA